MATAAKRLPKLKRSKDPNNIGDAFTNALARIGFGQPSVENGAQYPMTRFTFEYWTLQSLYRSSWVVAKVIDGYPNDMFKNGVDILGLSLSQKKDIEKVIRVTSTYRHLLKALKWARLFGGAACLIIIDGQDEILEDPLDIESIGIGDYCGLVPLDRWSGIFPGSELVRDIRSPDFGQPEFYRISTVASESFRVHHSRVLRFIGHDLPSWERQVEQYWGISEIERLIEELKRWDNAVGSAIGLLMRANIFTVKFDELASALSGVGMNQQALQQFYSILQAQNWAMSNQGMLILPEEGGLENHSYSFAGIDDVLMLFRGNIAGATEYPQSKLFGETHTGLGQTNEGDEGMYYDNVKQKQSRELTPVLDRLLPIISMSTLGTIPDELDHKWPNGWIPTGKEKAEIVTSNVNAIVSAVNAGIISPRRALTELKLQGEETSMFSSVTDEEINAASDEVTSAMDLAMAEPDEEEK